MVSLGIIQVLIFASSALASPVSIATGIGATLRPTRILSTPQPTPNAYGNFQFPLHGNPIVTSHPSETSMALLPIFGW
ncbi:hypothetical protein C8Q75DRAFT_804707 [Abortiporus biennis]|nr:hypothetical protein C8Q75DRAFT_804707 [Abortiporus biennis]